VKRETRFLLNKAIDSLVLSIELFNRPDDRGRVHGVLIMLDHSFEMLLKAAILHQGGKIRNPKEKHTIGFEACIRKALSDSDLEFLTEEQALTLQIINGYRDAAQHHLLYLSEHYLYLQAQAGLTLFRDLYERVFDSELRTQLPERVLPLSTAPPGDLIMLFDAEVEEIKRLLQPGKRRKVEATARLRALEIMEGAIKGETTQPGQSQLQKVAKAVHEGKSWEQIWPGIASLNFTTQGHGPSLDLRITKKEGFAVQVVPESVPGVDVVGVKRVNELDFYSLSHKPLAEKVDLTPPRTTAIVMYLDLKSDPDCFKQVAIGKSRFDRYSPKAIAIIKETLRTKPIDEIWASHGTGRKSLK
jgi:hypothetical protein